MFKKMRHCYDSTTTVFLKENSTQIHWARVYRYDKKTRSQTRVVCVKIILQKNKSSERPPDNQKKAFMCAKYEKRNLKY